jgi:hypothetical protein
MSAIPIIPVEEIHTITQVYINNIFIDIQNRSITIEVRKQDTDGNTIEQQTLLASGLDYHNIYDEDVMKEFVLSRLGLQVPEN